MAEINPSAKIEITPIELAIALYSALENDDPDAHLGECDIDDRISIDGRFDLIRVAKRIQDSLRKRPL